MKVPFSGRIYNEDKGFTKAVAVYEEPFLVQWSLEELAKENYFPVTLFDGNKRCRPLVLFSDRNEAVEKSLWFYEHDILPLVGESNNPEATVSAAGIYGINAILADTEILKKFIPALKAKYDLSRLRAVSVLGDNLDLKEIRLLVPEGAVLNLVLALPETGAFAECCRKALAKNDLIFHPDANSIVETDGRLIVTKLLYPATPVLRYQTGIFAEAADVSCSCGQEALRIL